MGFLLLLFKEIRVFSIMAVYYLIYLIYEKYVFQ